MSLDQAHSQIYLMKSDRGHKCLSCGGRFHMGQKVVSDHDQLYHLSCYAKATYEGTHAIGEPLRKAE